MQVNTSNLTPDEIRTLISSMSKPFVEFYDSTHFKPETKKKKPSRKRSDTVYIEEVESDEDYEKLNDLKEKTI